MKKKLLLLLLPLIVISCNKNDDDGNELINKEQRSYMFSEKSKLIISSNETSYLKYGTLKTGNNLVFEYEFSHEDNKQIADDEYTETIKFEIDSRLESFSFSNNELSDIKITLTPFCYCSFAFDESKNVDPTGTISGVKISDTEWKIKLNVTFYGNEEKSIDNIFKLK